MAGMKPWWGVCRAEKAREDKKGERMPDRESPGQLSEGQWIRWPSFHSCFSLCHFFSRPLWGWSTPLRHCPSHPQLSLHRGCVLTQAVILPDCIQAWEGVPWENPSWIAVQCVAYICTMLCVLKEDIWDAASTVVNWGISAQKMKTASPD